MTQFVPVDEFKSTRLWGGEEKSERALAWLGTELTKRQQGGLADQGFIVIFIEDEEGFSSSAKAQVDRLMREGHEHSIITYRRPTSPEGRFDPQVPAAQRFEPPLDFMPRTLDEIKQMIDQMITEMDARSKKKGNK